MAFSKQTLSGSTSGRPIEVVATASPGTTIHTIGATATSGHDMVYLYAANSAATDALLNLELGATATTDLFEITITARDGPILVCPGIAFTATDTIIRAYATATGGIGIVGYVNRSA